MARDFISIGFKLAVVYVTVTVALAAAMWPAVGLRRPGPAVLIIAAAALVAALVALMLYDRSVNRPMSDLSATADRVVKGDMGARAEIRRPPEFAALADGINNMIDSVVRSQSTADMDKLTGLYNYRHLHNYLDTQINLAARYDRRLTVAMIDIDRFKRINDRYGRRTGDEILKKAADYIKSSLREVDYVARFGGEEFMVVMPETAAAPAMMVMERVREEFSDRVFATGADKKSPVFVSIGVADFPLCGEDTANLLAAADMALLLAKRRGRNQVAYSRALDQKAG